MSYLDTVYGLKDKVKPPKESDSPWVYTWDTSTFSPKWNIQWTDIIEHLQASGVLTTDDLKTLPEEIKLETSTGHYGSQKYVSCKVDGKELRIMTSFQNNVFGPSLQCCVNYAGKSLLCEWKTFEEKKWNHVKTLKQEYQYAFLLVIALTVKYRNQVEELWDVSAMPGFS